MSVSSGIGPMFTIVFSIKAMSLAPLPSALLEKQIARKNGLYQALELLARQLDIPEALHQQAVSHYTAVSDWLHACPVLGPLKPRVFGQGSFALGTTIRPFKGDEYDLDFICHLRAAHRARHSQRDIYTHLFNRLKNHGTYGQMVEMKNRCVRVRYANEFHLDITPAVSNPLCAQGGLLVPDRQLTNYKASNPEGYATWFNEIADRQPIFPLLDQARNGRHIRLSASTDAIPDPDPIRGVLRRTVQLLKRHRDQYADRNPRLYAPISIIITTLAAHAYALVITQGPFNSPFDVLNATVALMPRFIIEPHAQLVGAGGYLVENPTTQGENFADKWTTPTFYAEFMQWHAAAKQEFLALESQVGSDQLQEALRSSFGARDVDAAYSQQVAAINQARPTKQVNIGTAGIAAAAARKPLVVPGNNFFGR